MNAPCFDAALRLVRGARDEAFANELYRLERSGLSPDEAARVARRAFRGLDEAELCRHAAAIAPILAGLAATNRRVAAEVARLRAAAEDLGGGNRDPARLQP